MIRRRISLALGTDADGLHHHPALPWPIEIRRHPRARKMLLRLDEPRRRLRLTLPARASLGPALDWAGGQRAWVESRLAAIEPRRPLAPGQVIPFDGGELRLVHDAAAARAPVLVDGSLVAGGPAAAFAARIERYLRGRARVRMAALTADMAAAAGVTIVSVAVGDAATRWGSCTATGAIRYNWRLILAPPSVQRYLAAHEVAHRQHMDHGAAFHALEEHLFGGPVGPARSALRRIGRVLRGIG